MSNPNPPPIRHASNAKSAYRNVIVTRPYPKPRYVPMSPRSSSTRRLIVVRLIITATTRNTIGNALPSDWIELKSDLSELKPLSAVRGLHPLALRARERHRHRHARRHLRGLRVERLELLVELAALCIEPCLRSVDFGVRLFLRARQFVLRTLLQRVTPRLRTLRLHVAFTARDRRRHERVVIVAERVFVLRIC